MITKKVNIAVVCGCIGRDFLYS